MSRRQDVAERLKEYFRAMSLDEVYGIVEGYGPNKQYRSLTFCRSRYIDGLVHIYGPKFIRVMINGEAPMLFNSVSETLDYFYNRFGEPEDFTGWPHPMPQSIDS